MYPYQNPNYYYYQPQMYPYFQRMPKKFNLQHTLHTTIRGIQIAKSSYSYYLSSKTIN